VEEKKLKQTIDITKMKDDFFYYQYYDAAM
jgi:hypothetical protein